MAENYNIKGKNPWIGLKSYTEGLPLYGRDEEIESLSSRILYNVQTVVYGRSGIGKSSIINAGVFPILREQGILPIYIRFEHNDKPYIKQISEAIDKELVAKNFVRKEIVERHLDADGNPMIEETLWEYFHRMAFADAEGNEIKPLIVIDQFEEIFTLEKDHKKMEQFFVELADLLNHTKPSTLVELEEKLYVESDSTQDSAAKEELTRKGKISALLKNKTRHRAASNYLEEDKFHIVLTIREDFLSHLERHTTRIPSLKQNRYCLQPINQKQAAQIILQPCPGLIDTNTAKLIIERITGESNFELDDSPEIFVDSAVLSLYLSRLFEKMPEGEEHITSSLVRTSGKEIIKDFYNESMSEYPQEVVDFLEDNLLNNEGHRENISEYNALASCPALTKEMLDTMANDRKIIRKFPYNNAIRIEFIHDILCSVVMERKEQRKHLRLAEKQNREFLLQQQRTRRKMRRVVAGSAIAISLTALILLFFGYWYTWKYSERYASFIRVNGWPVGVGDPLSEQEAKELTIYYELSRKGRNGSTPFNRVDVCSGGDVVLPNFTMPIVGDKEEEDINATQFASLKMRTSYILFTGVGNDKKEGVSKETYYDKNEVPLFSISYSHSSLFNDSETEEKSQKNSYIWALFCDASGTAMQVRDNGADRMRILVDSLGYETMYTFYNSNQSPCANYVGAYGFKVHYKEDSPLIDTLRHLNQFGEVTMVEVRNYGKGTVSEKYYNADCTTLKLFLGRFAQRTIETDKQGNKIRCKYFDERGQLMGDGNVAIEESEYDSSGRVVQITYKDKNGKMITRRGKHNNYSYVKYFYAPQATSHYKEYRYLGKDMVYRMENTGVDYIIENDYENYFIHRQTSNLPNGGKKKVYLDKDGNPVLNSEIGYCFRIIRERVTESGKWVVASTFDEHNRLIDVDKYATDSSFYDKKEENRTKQFRFKADGKAVLAMGYEYSDGLERCRYALSLDGKTPIRCPQLEADGMSYYKLKEARNLTKFGLAFIEAESEYPGCESHIKSGLKSGDIPNGEKIEMGDGWIIQNKWNLTFPDTNDSIYWVSYLHITSLEGEAYKHGVRDGDLLISCNAWQYNLSLSSASSARLIKEDVAQKLQVLRYTDKKWKLLEFFIESGNKGVEAYPVYYTEAEYEYFKNGLQYCKSKN